MKKGKKKFNKTDAKFFNIVKRLDAIERRLNFIEDNAVAITTRPGTETVKDSKIWKGIEALDAGYRP